MFSETIQVSVTYQRKITFFLRMIGIQEERDLRALTFGLSDEEKAEKEYQNNVDVLAKLSEKMPVGLFPDKPKVTAADDQTVYINDFKIPDVAIRKFFETKTPTKERIAFYAVQGYFARLMPEESFF